jgi:hypothetical protein
MDNKSTINSLKDFAKQSKRNIHFSEISYPISFPDRMTYHKRTFCIPNNTEELSFLIGYSDPKNLSENELFFGVFIPLSISKTKTLKIRRKDILDKLNPFLKQKIFQTNNKIFDSKTIITGNEESLINIFLNDLSIQNLILSTLETNETFEIGINEFNLDFVPAFKEKSHFGIFTKQQWIMDSSIIENLFAVIEQLRVLIIEKQFI